MGAVQVRLASDGFLSTPSARRATVALCNRNIGILISIHALREEGDTSAVTGTVIPSDFYPRPPRGGRLSHPSRFLFYRFISIHALREEGDHFVHHLHHHPADFYPRPPRGGRPIFARPAIMFVTFLSTPSAWRATTYDVICQCFSQISIHALSEQGDYEVYSSAAADMIFLSTPSARRATFAWARAAKKRERFLSTPSARRATSGRCPRLRQDRYFYPRPPRGGRRPEPLPTRRSGYFYPRPPRGGRHASRRHRQHRANFYPRPPRGGRQGGVDGLSNGRLISIHALREEGDHVAQPGQLANLLFLSTPSARRATHTGGMV